MGFNFLPAKRPEEEDFRANAGLQNDTSGIRSCAGVTRSALHAGEITGWWRPTTAGGPAGLLEGCGQDGCDLDV